MTISKEEFLQKEWVQKIIKENDALHKLKRTESVKLEAIRRKY